MGYDLHHYHILYIDDVRDATVSCHGKCGATSSRIRFRHLHEPRTHTKNSRRWPVLHTQGLHKGCGIRIGCVHLHRFDNIPGLDAQTSAKQFISAIVNDFTMRSTATDIHFGSAHEKGCIRIVSRFQRDLARIDASHSTDVRVC